MSSSISSLLSFRRNSIPQTTPKENGQTRNLIQIAGLLLFLCVRAYDAADVCSAVKISGRRLLRFSADTSSRHTFGWLRTTAASGVSAFFCTTPRIGTTPSRSVRMRAEYASAWRSMRPISSIRIRSQSSASASAASPAVSNASGNDVMPSAGRRMPTRLCALQNRSCAAAGCR